MPLVEVLAAMEAAGIAVHTDTFRAQRNLIGKRLHQLEHKIKQLVAETLMSGYGAAPDSGVGGKGGQPGGPKRLTEAAAKDVRDYVAGIALTNKDHVSQLLYEKLRLPPPPAAYGNKR